MKPDRWQRVRTILEDALELPPNKRSHYLEKACAGDPELREEVDSLLAYREAAESFLEGPPASGLRDPRGPSGSATSDVGEEPELVGRVLSHYKILAKKGRGGMGEVYLARDQALGRDVAIKVLRQKWTSDPDGLRRFEQEARSASALNHPNIITIYEIGEYEGTPFIAMEHVEGKTLRDILGGAPLPTKKLLPIATQIAEGLAKAHAAGIVHRDLKPENLMVTSDGLVKILDFGLAKLTGPLVEIQSETEIKVDTQAGMILGTVKYMSPEQASGRSVDYRSDQFSLGLILYEMATGKPPFKRDTAAATLAAIIERKAEPMTRLDPSLPGSFRRTVARCLVKEPEGRYASTDDVAKQLEQVRDGLSGMAPGLWLRRSAMIAMGGLLATLLAVVGLNVGEIRDRNLGGVSGIRSVAVLPLKNVSGDPEQEYFSDGITEALISDLAQIGALKVISRTSAMRYKGTGKTLPEIARELNVDAVLEGSILLAGDRVQITAQLIEAETERKLWADDYERDVRDIFSVQGEVTQAIAQAIQIRLTPAELKQLTGARPVNPEAYQAYLKGRYFFEKRSPEGLKSAVEHFEYTVRVDPQYALGYVALADTYILLGNYGERPSDEVKPQAKAVALKALELDETLAEAHVSLGAVLWEYERDYLSGERELLRAIELKPNYAMAHHRYASFLAAMGRQEEGIAAMRIALLLDPLSLRMNVDLGRAYYFAQRYDDAIDVYRMTLELDPDFRPAHSMLGLAYAETGQYEQAIAEIKSGTSDESWSVWLGYAYAKAGDTEKASETIELWKARWNESRQEWAPITIALIYVGLGEREQALAWLETAFTVAHSGGGFTMIKAYPYWNPLRSDPRFQDLLRRMNFPE